MDDALARGAIKTALRLANGGLRRIGVAGFDRLAGSLDERSHGRARAHVAGAQELLPADLLGPALLSDKFFR